MTANAAPTEDKKAAGKKPVAKAKEPKAVKPEREKKNGVVRPGSETTTGRVWAIADTLTKKTKKTAMRKDVLEACATETINAATAATQYGRWRKFNGHIGRDG